MTRHPVTVILPCAGGGSRLGLPFPKELAPLGPGRVVIDSCLDLIRAAGESCDPRVLLLTDGNRDLTAHYIRGRLPGVSVATVLQHAGARDMTDGVLGLEPWLGYVNALLMPDAVYSWAGNPVAEVTVKTVGYGFAVAAAKAPPEDIRAAGALRVADDQVTAYEDKPADPSGYDALWGILGFNNAGCGLGALRAIAGSSARTRTGPVTEWPVRGAPVTWLAGYRDCGTWDRYTTELRESDAV